MKIWKIAAIAALGLTAFAADNVAPTKAELEEMYNTAYRDFDAGKFPEALKQLDTIDARQPDLAELVRVGYLLRTTAVYGNGKFGLADLGRLWRDGIFALPYEAEMLVVYMIRQFSFDLVEHIARARNPAGATRLSAESKRALGIGNATGLGMAPFLVAHPSLLKWVAAAEQLRESRRKGHCASLLPTKTMPRSAPAMRAFVRADCDY